MRANKFTLSQCERNSSTEAIADDAEYVGIEFVTLFIVENIECMPGAYIRVRDLQIRAQHNYAGTLRTDEVIKHVVERLGCSIKFGKIHGYRLKK
jgi:hypothetical protein